MSVVAPVFTSSVLFPDISLRAPLLGGVTGYARVEHDRDRSRLGGTRTVEAVAAVGVAVGAAELDGERCGVAAVRSDRPVLLGKTVARLQLDRISGRRRILGVVDARHLTARLHLTREDLTDRRWWRGPLGGRERPHLVRRRGRGRDAVGDLQRFALGKYRSTSSNLHDREADGLPTSSSLTRWHSHIRDGADRRRQRTIGL